MIDLCCKLGCDRERPFTNFFTFRDHVYRLHSGVTTSVCERDLPTVDFRPSHLHAGFSWGESFDSSNDDQPTEKDAPVDYAAKLQRSAATFILKVQEKNNIPQSTMEKVIKEVDSLYQVNFF